MAIQAILPITSDDKTGRIMMPNDAIISIGCSVCYAFFMIPDLKNTKKTEDAMRYYITLREKFSVDNTKFNG